MIAIDRGNFRRIPCQRGLNRVVAGYPVGTAESKAGPNNVRKIREGLLLSKAELARRAGISVLTLDRVEKGMNCRMDTKRKIILSLGLQLTDRDKVFSNP